MEQGPMHLQLLMARLPAQFASLLGALALILATVGVYGIVSFTVVRRTREIGVRLALGAEPRDVVWLMIGDSLRPALWGAVLGLTGATALTVLLLKLVVNPELPDFTYGAAQFPLPTLAAVVGILAAALLGGALVPALRAAKVDPIATLRAE